MKLGRIARLGPSGRVPRLFAVDPASGELVDLVAAETVRRLRRGATREAAARIAEARFPSSLSAALDRGMDAFLEDVRTALEEIDEKALIPAGESVFLSPADPRVMRDCLAFEEHVHNGARRTGGSISPSYYEFPSYYKGSPAGLIGHRASVRWPAYTQSMDYELEFALVVGTRGTNLQPEETIAHILGATIMNDFSARDMQALEMVQRLGPCKGKDFATALGPWITTLDELDVHDLEMIARVNGAEWSRGSSATITWKPEELVAYISYGEEILPGDVIGSGTVGNGCGLELGRELRPGDEVELEISGIGVLRNRLGQPETEGWAPTPRRARTEAIA